MLTWIFLSSFRSGNHSFALILSFICPDFVIDVKGAKVDVKNYWDITSNV